MLMMVSTDEIQYALTGLRSTRHWPHSRMRVSTRHNVTPGTIESAPHLDHCFVCGEDVAVEQHGGEKTFLAQEMFGPQRQSRAEIDKHSKTRHRADGEWISSADGARESLHRKLRVGEDINVILRDCAIYLFLGYMC